MSESPPMADVDPVPGPEKGSGHKEGNNEDTKDTAAKEGGSDDEDETMLFPSLKMKQPQDSARASSRSSYSQQELRRRVDTSWLSRCTGLQVAEGEVVRFVCLFESI